MQMINNIDMYHQPFITQPTITTNQQTVTYYMQPPSIYYEVFTNKDITYESSEYFARIKIKNTTLKPLQTDIESYKITVTLPDEIDTSNFIPFDNSAIDGIHLYKEDGVYKLDIFYEPNRKINVYQDEFNPGYFNIDIAKKDMPYKYKITLDAGHGGHTPGAVNKGIMEKNINLNIVKKMIHYLNYNGIDVVLTRDKDIFVDLDDRAKIANSNNSDIFVSVHVNSSFNKKADGISTYYTPNRLITEKQALANAIQNSLIDGTKENNIGVLEDNFAVTRLTTMPSVLVEVGFLSNDRKAMLLTTDEYQSTLAYYICQGILNFLKQQQ